MKCIFFSILFILVMYNYLYSDSYETIENKYIEVLIHNQSGRYIIKTTGGDPELENDHDSLLLYRDILFPDDTLTSFTTLKIDGKDYKFGGTGGRFSKQPVKVEDRIVCTWSRKGLYITQIVAVVNGKTSGYPDTVKISYRIWNRDKIVHKVGVRVLLDTLLGITDGAPFRIPGIGSITEERSFLGNDIPQFWYSFDNLLNPTVKAMGTLRGDNSHNVIRPDMVVFGKWKKMKKGWNFDLKEGRRIINDTAVAIYWNQRMLLPGEMYNVETYYGLYGTSIFAGDVFSLSLGGPLETVKQNFEVNVDYQNISPVIVNDIKLEIELPKGFGLNKSQTSIINIKPMKMKEIGKHSWNIKMNNILEDTYYYKVSITGKTINGKLALTEVTRGITYKKIEKNIQKKIEKQKQLVQTIKKQDKDIDIKQINEFIVIEFSDINFQYKSSSLTSHARILLDKIGNILKNNMNISISVNGFTDNIGSDEYNLILSEERAMNVWKYIVDKNFISEDRIIYRGYGEQNPIANNSTEEGRKKNRRVELIINGS